MDLIVQHLRKYTVALFHDQYGNYVLQCCLRFGTPWNDFVFEAMMARMWEIAQGRFGARAMRACLESHHASKEQQKMLAACIALHSVQLASNANGALLLTWFLDTCNFARRRTVLAPRLVPHLVHLCTHKVAYLTVLKVINQRGEPEARDIILKALFFSPNDQVLEDILRDHSCGATLIFKVLTTPFFDEGMRKEVQENIRNVLTRIKAQAGQGYKRLMDEVGMSTRNTGSQSSHAQKEHSRENGVSNNERIRAPTGPAAGNQNHMGHNNQSYSNNYYGGAAAYPQTVQAGIPRMDPSGVMSGFGPMNMMGMVPDAMAALQIQQYQALLAAQTAGGIPAAGMYPPMAPLGYPQGPAAPQERAYPNQAGNPNAPNGPQGGQQGNMGASPFLAGLAPQAFNPILAQQMLASGYAAYGQMPLYPPQAGGGIQPQVQQVQQAQQPQATQQGNQQGNPRRGGRVSLHEPS
jgi:protein JSN1